jgi:hypothetical protein
LHSCPHFDAQHISVFVERATAAGALVCRQ